MKSIKTNAYIYIAFKKRFFCTKQNLFSLIARVILKNQQLALSSHEIYPKDALQLVKKLLLLKFKKHPDYSTALKLPIRGHMCAKVNNGFKIFNLKKREVTKLFHTSVSINEIEKEICNAQQVSSFDFAPIVISSNLTERVYTELLINGILLFSQNDNERVDLLKTYHRGVNSSLFTMATQPLPQEIDLKQYLETLSTHLKILKQSTCGKNNTLALVFAFTEQLLSQLRNTNPLKMHTTLSHGDFSLKNILFAKNKTWVIDWETLSSRSLFNDFHNFFFTEYYYGRNLYETVTASVTAYNSFKKQLSAIHKGELSFSNIDNIYRNIFYLERIITLLERDTTGKDINVLVRSVKLFDDYEHKWIQHEKTMLLHS